MHPKYQDQKRKYMLPKTVPTKRNQSDRCILEALLLNIPHNRHFNKALNSMVFHDAIRRTHEPFHFLTTVHYTTLHYTYWHIINVYSVHHALVTYCTLHFYKIPS